MDNSVNCWKPTSINDMAISSQASNEEGSETIREDGVRAERPGSAEHPVKDEDIVRSPEKSVSSEARVYKIYYLVSPSTDWYYIGMTKNKLNTRFNQHTCAAKRGIKFPLYSCMRKHSDFIIAIKDDCLTYKEACAKEIALIKEAKEYGHKILNLAVGGEGGFRVTDVDSWKAKIRVKRIGRKPALGMKHTDENKKKFSNYGKLRWDIYGRYPTSITELNFKEASNKYGISKTHYYRLKRSLSSDQ